MIIPRPRLYGRLGQSARVTLLSAPPGAGKTVLLRSWAAEEGLAEQTGWVTVPDKPPDPGCFWIGVLDALRGTGAVLAPEVTAAPGLDGWAIVHRLIEDLGLLEDPVWLVIDDLHKLATAETVRQLELLVTRAPAQLRLVLSTRTVDQILAATIAVSDLDRSIGVYRDGLGLTGRGEGIAAVATALLLRP